MNPITTIEDALIAEAKAVLGQTVKEVESRPGGWTHDSLTRALQFAPGVYVGFMGAKRGAAEGYQDLRFSLYCVTKGVDDVARRRGTSKVIGAYDIAYLLLQNLDGFQVPQMGLVRCAGINNLFRDAMFDLGGAVYSLELIVPNVDCTYQADLTTLSDFVLWHADHYNVGGMAAGETPLATDEVSAP